MDIDTDNDVFFGKKPTETYRTLNCQHRNSINNICFRCKTFF